MGYVNKIHFSNSTLSPLTRPSHLTLIYLLPTSLLFIWDILLVSSHDKLRNISQHSWDLMPTSYYTHILI